MLVTWTRAQALPPLGRALDMRDSHPASKLTGREVPRLLSLTVGFDRTAGWVWRLLDENSMVKAYRDTH